MKSRRAAQVLLAFFLAASSALSLHAQDNPHPEVGSLNKPDRLEWFRDQGFGLFIHWSVDSQLGIGISHSLVGASDAYVQRFYTDLPRTFNPKQFDAQAWAELAKVAGVRYVVFTTKHHSGFAMYDTATTPFNIMNTPFHRDITAEIFKAFSAQGIANGVYYSPDDFYWLNTHHKELKRNVPEVQPSANPGLLQYDLAQVKELLTHYGKIDLAFFDGQADGLRDLAWQLQPDIVVTRGAIQTPEQYVPGMPLQGAWESCITIGQAWQYQAQNDTYKSSRELIHLLIQTRAKGGNLLLDVGPKPNGELPIEEEERMREMGLWMFVNGEAIYGTRPWVITNEGDVWFTKKQDTLYAIIDSDKPWEYGRWNDVVLHSVKTSPATEVSVLGENGRVLEYQPGVDPKPTWQATADGLHIHAMMAQRLQDNRKWPNPVVLRITHVTPSFNPPAVSTVSSSEDPATHAETLQGNLTDMAGSSTLQVGFEYRSLLGEDIHARTDSWLPLPLQTVSQTGPFTLRVDTLPPGLYEFHAIVKHPVITLYGADIKMRRK